MKVSPVLAGKKLQTKDNITLSEYANTRTCSVLSLTGCT